MQDLQDLMSRLVEGSEQIVGSPSTIDRLRKLGIQFKQVPERTFEEGIDLLFAKRKKTALELATKLPDPPIIAAPAIESLYNEITECIVFGLHGAAITLSGILVEFVLKYVTYFSEIGGVGEYDAKKWDELENIAFGATIKRAAKAGLLIKEEVEKLENFKDTIRNPYNHYNIKKITHGMVWEKIKVLDTSTRKIEERDIAAEDNPVIQAQSKPIVDMRQVFLVFEFADYMVKILFKRIEGLKEKIF